MSKGHRGRDCREGSDLQRVAVRSGLAIPFLFFAGHSKGVKKRQQYSVMNFTVWLQESLPVTGSQVLSPQQKIPAPELSAVP